jgi:hypothetical protein
VRKKVVPWPSLNSHQNGVLMRLGDFLADGQSDAGLFLFLDRFQPCERQKDLVAPLFANPNPVILQQEQPAFPSSSFTRIGISALRSLRYLVLSPIKRSQEPPTAWQSAAGINIAMPP